jgi:hypothetical protein
MARFSMKKWPPYAIAAYLVLAAIGTFTLAAFDAPILDNPAEESPAQGVLTSGDHFTYTPAIIETKDSSFSPLRHNLLRVIMPLSLLSAGPGLLCSAVRPITRTAIKADKNNIRLKLRI